MSATDRPDPEQMRILAALDAESKLARYPEEDDTAIRRRLRAWQLHGRAWLD